ncbi:MAG: hypothetical protein LDL33_04320 [Desulfomonile sp.]|nr:hypothetical protein [Desulfomonile sp.]
MVEKQKTGQKSGEEAAPVQSRDEWDIESESEVLALPLASAKSVPKPTTALAAPPKGNIGQIKVSIVGDSSHVPDLSEVDNINSIAGARSRTPLMTVIEAVLASHGGSLTLAELTERVGKHWNRPFPASPYSKEEFIYVVASNSDRVRLN